MADHAKWPITMIIQYTKLTFCIDSIKFALLDYGDVIVLAHNKKDPRTQGFSVHWVETFSVSRDSIPGA